MNGLRILLVDDEPALNAAMVLVIETLGHAAHGCAGLDCCKEQLRASRFDVMILDLNLGAGPDDGVKLVNEIRELGLALPPTVVLSAQAPEELAAAARAIGTRTFLRKPCSSKELHRAMMAVLEE